MPRRPSIALASIPAAIDVDPKRTTIRDLIASIYAGAGGELHQLVAAEVRAAMGRTRLSGVGLAKQMGTSRAFVGRRLSDETSFDLNDLEAVSLVLDVSLEELIVPALRELDRRRQAAPDTIVPGVIARDINGSCSNGAGQTAQARSDEARRDGPLLTLAASSGAIVSHRSAERRIAS